MTDKNSGFDDLIDRMIENPAYDQMGVSDFPQKIRDTCDYDSNRPFHLHFIG